MRLATTRPLDPVNTIASLVKKGEYVTPDRKQGQEWLNNSVRYVDELLDAMDVYNKPEQKQNALTSSEGRVPILRLLGRKRRACTISYPRDV